MANTSTRHTPRIVVPNPDQPSPLAKTLSEHLGIPLTAPSLTTVDTTSKHEALLHQIPRKR